MEEEQRLRVEQARGAERRRIAREMHDVLAHRVALLSLHAGALEFRPDAPPQEIAEAAGVVRASARAALVDLREVIGVLRERDGGGGGAGSGRGRRRLPRRLRSRRSRRSCRSRRWSSARARPG